MDHPYKIINNKEIFRDQVLRASRILAEPVAATLGPDGLPILIKQYDGKPPKITKDGVTVANSIFFADPSIDTIIQAIKEASRKTNEEAGDGTTTAIVLTNAIIRESLKHIETGSVSPQALRSAMLQLEPKIVEMIAQWSTPIKSLVDMTNVALISSNGDVGVAESVVKAVDTAGDHGMIVIEEGFQPDIQVDHRQGFRLDVGFQKLGPVGPAFINRPERQTAEVLDPVIVIYDGDLSGRAPVASFINALMQKGQKPVPLIIVAYSFDIEAMAAILIGRSYGWSITPVKCPIYNSADLRRFTLDDLSVWVGAKVISHSRNSLTAIVSKENVVNFDYLGSCKKFVMDQFSTIMYDGRGTEEKILERVTSINANLDIAKSGYDKDIFKTRLAMMAGGIIHISVGAGTEFEMKERKDRVEDALSAVRASIKEGVVPGGGMVFLRASELLKNIEVGTSVSHLTARSILSTVLQEPIRQLALNVGVSPDLLVKDALNFIQTNPMGGWNARSGEFCADMIVSGIIDPLTVIKSALKNAISISVSLLSGGGSVVYGDKKAKEKKDIEGFYVDEK